MKNLLAKRSGTAARIILSLLPLPHLTKKPQSEITFVSMCGVNHVGCLQQCLLSLYRSWSSLPQIQIVSDGSISLSKLELALSWWPGDKSFSMWQESVEYHQKLGRESLAKFAFNNSLGKKLAVILRFGECEKTLWCDSDILWFKELSHLPLQDRDNCLPILKLTEDYQESYDQNLLKVAGLNHLSKLPSMNTGLVFLNGDLITTCALDPLLAQAANEANHFTEQTILAQAAHQLGLQYWSREDIACFEYDKLHLLPTYLGKHWIARHYIGPVRYSFWRDALALRLTDFIRQNW